MTARGDGFVDEMSKVPTGAHIHIVGIGGSGMSAIARVLLERGIYRVSGSDRSLSEVGQALEGLGATVYDGHRAEQVGDADLVVVSSAVPADNAEVEAARARGIPVVKRPQFLTWLTGANETIAVAGTAGKTTTTAMIAGLLLHAGLDPSFVIGGVLPGTGSNARAGRGAHFVIEADEYDHTFLALRPQIAVVTNVEWDHPDCYPTYADVEAAFAAFADRLQVGGLLVVCGDDPGARKLAEGQASRQVLRYGLSGSCDVWATATTHKAMRQDFDLVVRGERHGRFTLRVPGEHNLHNALAACAVAQALRIPDAVTRAALAAFQGVGRRFELKGEVASVTVIDDYAHHPTKIRAALAAARQCFPEQTIWAVFQPHTYSRTQALLADYQSSFADADHVLITPIYAARERDENKVSSADLVRGADHRDMRCVDDLKAATDVLARNLKAGDVLVTMGAGDSYRVGEGVLSILRERVK